MTQARHRHLNLHSLQLFLPRMVLFRSRVFQITFPKHHFLLSLSFLPSQIFTELKPRHRWILIHLLNFHTLGHKANPFLQGQKLLIRHDIHVHLFSEKMSSLFSHGVLIHGIVVEHLRVVAELPVINTWVEYAVFALARLAWHRHHHRLGLYLGTSSWMLDTVILWQSWDVVEAVVAWQAS